jgi:hypothetical protein
VAAQPELVEVGIADPVDGALEAGPELDLQASGIV